MMKSLVVGLSLIVTAGAAWATVERWTPFALQSDFMVIASMSTDTALNWKFDQILTVERQLREAEARKDKQSIEILRNQLERLKFEFRQLEQQRQRIQQR